jgi:hypothetical protein
MYRLGLCLDGATARRASSTDAQDASHEDQDAGAAEEAAPRAHQADLERVMGGDGANQTHNTDG